MKAERQADDKIELPKASEFWALGTSKGRGESGESGAKN